MRKYLRRFLAFLDARFPEQIVVTLQDYKELREEVGNLNKYVQGAMQLQTKLEPLREDVELIRANLGYVASKKSFNGLER